MSVRLTRAVSFQWRETILTARVTQHCTPIESNFWMFLQNAVVG